MTAVMDLWWAAHRMAEWTMYPYLRDRGWQVEWEPNGTGLWHIERSPGLDNLLIEDAVLLQKAIEEQAGPAHSLTIEEVQP